MQEFLQIKLGSDQSIFIKIHKETSQYFYVNSYPKIGISSKYGLKVKGDLTKVRLHKTEVLKRHGIHIISKHKSIPIGIEEYRVFS